MRNNNNNESQPTATNTPKSVLQLNQPTFLPQYIKNSANNASNSNVQGVAALASSLLSSQQSQLRFRPLELPSPSSSSSTTATATTTINNFNLPPQNLINVPFFKSINIQNGMNSINHSKLSDNAAMLLATSHSSPMDTAPRDAHQESSNQSSSPLNVFNKNIVTS